MKYDFLGIAEQKIVGIKNPKFLMKGTVLLKKPKFTVKVNDQVRKCETTIKKDEFYIELLLEKKDKKIQVYVTSGKEKYLICETKNNLLRRVKHKLIEICRRVLNARIIQKIKYVGYTLYKGVRLAWREHHFLIPPALWPKYFKALKDKFRNGTTGSIFLNPMVGEEYRKWITIFEEKEPYAQLKYNPLISIVIPVYNISEDLLTECIDSVLNQTYQNFEICLADDASTKEETIETLKKYEKKDKRIKVIYREKNGHISEASNSALSLATGEYIALMDNDDMITEDALYEMVKVLNNDKSIDMIYTDEDKLDLNGRRCDPNFKSDFAPDTLLSNNYICHFTLLRKKIVDEIGGWRKGYEGAQDYDLFLRFTEKTNKIYHIPKLLYRWRMIPGSTSMTIDNKNYAVERGKMALEDALKRRKIKGEVLVHKDIPYFIMNYTYEKEPKVSILIPTRDYADTLEECLSSIYEKTIYKNFEIIVLDNQSKEEKTFKLFKKYSKKYKNFKVIEVNTEFNFSHICNVGVQNAKGEYIVLLNNDTSIITKEWLNIMVGYAMQKHIGAVGVKLLYPDNTVQHAGVIAGLGGVAAHAFINATDTDYGAYGRLAVPYNYSAVTAACLMVSKKKYLEVNGFEEKLKVAYNDIDFNFKMLEAGYYNVFLPQVKLHHYESKSRGLDTTTEKYKRFLEESNYMYKKWDKYIKNDPFYNPNLSLYSSYMLNSSKHMNDEDEKSEK